MPHLMSHHVLHQLLEKLLREEYDVDYLLVVMDITDVNDEENNYGDWVSFNEETQTGTEGTDETWKSCR